MVRARRCASTPITDELIRNGSTPMSTRRVAALGASLVWRVDRTRWPVSEAWIAISAVSLSRISPTMMMSGSCRKKDRRPLANVRPALGLIWTWFTRGSWYSTGSSTVLREAALGDVQVGHDLDARDDRGLQRLGRRHHVVQQTVDPVARLHTAAVRLDVNVAGTVADGLADDHVDQPDDRSLLGEGAELFNRELLTLFFRNLDVFGDGLTHRLFQIHAAGVVLADGGHDVLFGGDDGFDLQPGDQPYVVKCHDVERIGNCQLQLLPGLLNRQDLVPVRQVLGHDLHDVGIDLQRPQLDVRHAPLNGQHFCQLLLRQRALFHQDPAEMTAGAVLHLNRPVQLLPAHHLFVQQNLAQGFRAGARPGARRLRVLGWRRELRSTRWSRDLPLPGRLWARWRRRFGRLWHRPGWFCLRWFSPGRLGPRWLDPWRLDPRRLDPGRLDLRRLYSRRGRRGRGLSYRCRRLAVGWRRRRDWHPRQRVRRLRPRPAW